ncbi:MAG: BspA family leucine-rich repeat surface protein, partial [Clostridium sp.]|nr:BspA family leucine-rich repeat surface protein [Clostridium sp.]
YNKPNDSITSSNSNIVKLLITNSSTSSQNIAFTMKGGYITNTIQDIITPSTYSEITLVETPSTNTYFCKTNDTLAQGLKYVNGQYTYAYKQQGDYSSSGLGWSNISNNGWGVQLTDKTSTDAVTSKVCTYINNKPITSMSYMFGYSQATIIDVNNLNTSNITNMETIFFDTKATTLDVSNFDTSNVKNMRYMFSGSKATTLDVSNFDTSKVTSMYGMFTSAKVETLDLSSFNTSNVTNMGYMLSDIQTTTLDISNFDTSKVTNMSGMFSSIKVATLDLSNFDTSNVTNMNCMFTGAKATTLDLSSFDTSNVTDMSRMFEGTKATTLNLSNFNTSNVTNMYSMFGAIQATTLDLSIFNTSNVTDMRQMFERSINLKTIYVSNKFNTDKVTYSTNMFSGCTNLVGGAGTKYNSSYVDKTYARIDGGTSNPGYFTDIADKPSEPNSFATDSWPTIINAVKNNNIGKYNIGDTKTIDMGTYGTHTLRIANTSTPSECSTSGFSQSACGFVLEFADIITTHAMNTTDINTNGWPASAMRTFVNNDIYNSLPTDLKKGIIDTMTVSGNGSPGGTVTSTDKIFLLASAEVWGEVSSHSYLNNYDNGKDLTRQLDYYKSLAITTSKNRDKLIKSDGSGNTWWRLRSGYSGNTYYFFCVDKTGTVSSWNANTAGGVSPAFRIG